MGAGSSTRTTRLARGGLLAFFDLRGPQVGGGGGPPDFLQVGCLKMSARILRPAVVERRGRDRFRPGVWHQVLGHGIGWPKSSSALALWLSSPSSSERHARKWLPPLQHRQQVRSSCPCRRFHAMSGEVHSPYEEALFIIRKVHIRPHNTFGHPFLTLGPQSELNTKFSC